MKIFYIFALVLAASAAHAQDCDKSFTKWKWWQTASLEQVKIMLKNGCSMNQSDELYGTPVKYLAAVYSNPVTFKGLIETELIRLNEPDLDGNTPLMQIATLQTPGSAQKIDYLIKKKAKINLRNTWGSTALHYALAHSSQNLMYFEILSSLNGAGADFTLRTGTGNSSLHQAVYSNYFPVITSYSPAVISKILTPELINSRNFFGETPLHIAAKNSTARTINILLENGADISLLNKNLETALHAAVKCWTKCNDGVIEALLNAGIDPFVKNTDGLTAYETVDKDSKVLLTSDFWILNDLMYKRGQQ